MSEPFRMFKNLTCLITKPQLGLNIPQAEQLWQGAGGRGHRAGGREDSGVGGMEEEWQQPLSVRKMSPWSVPS